jgi:16S rRNA (guanine966-N2)-methyltransferase
MRIIAGELRGRRLAPPPDRRVRPTADRVREALFNILGSDVPGATVLDLFAGSGALGLEALSRGARHVDFVEIGRASLRTLDTNAEQLGVRGRVTIHKGDALRFAERLTAGSYDVALADPPYSADQAARLAAAFREKAFARLLVVEHRVALPVDGDDTRRYGDIALTFLYAE